MTSCPPLKEESASRETGPRPGAESTSSLAYLCPLSSNDLVVAIKAANKAEEDRAAEVRALRDKEIAAVILRDVYDWLTGAQENCQCRVDVVQGKKRKHFMIKGQHKRRDFSQDLFGLTYGTAGFIAAELESKGLTCTIMVGESPTTCFGERNVQLECKVPGV